MPDRAALEKLTRDLGHVIQTMNCGFVARDLAGDLVFVNETLLRWLGYESEELLGRPAEELAPPELRALIREETKAAQEGDLRVRLVALQRKDSSTFPVLIIPQQFFDESDRLDGTFEMLVDLGAVQTAKPIRYRKGDELRQVIDRIAMELHTVSLTADLPVSAPLVLSHPEFQQLSPREHEVLMHLVGGSRVPAIAKQLFISQHTVRGHLKSMYRKLDVSTQSELIEKVRGLSALPAGEGADEIAG